MPSFDVVSKVDLAEVDNALEGARREISTRYDFKGAKATIERVELLITLLADDAMKLRQMQELVKGYFVRRKIDPLSLDFGTEERASGDMLRQPVTIREGIDRELGKTLVKAIKDAKLKVQAAIQGDELRITGKSRDELQTAIALIKNQKADRPLQFVNFRE